MRKLIFATLFLLVGCSDTAIKEYKMEDVKLSSSHGKSLDCALLMELVKEKYYGSSLDTSQPIMIEDGNRKVIATLLLERSECTQVGLEIPLQALIGIVGDNGKWYCGTFVCMLLAYFMPNKYSDEEEEFVIDLGKCALINFSFCPEDFVSL